MLFAFLAVGLYFTIATRGFQIRYLPLWLKCTLTGKNTSDSELRDTGSMNRFQALCTSLAATIGTGNIAGVATAIVAGGPGALFWMWVSAFLGMMTAYAEKLLGHVYRKRRPDGSYLGGAMVTMEYGLKSRGMGELYALLCLFSSLGMGNMTQSNSIAQAAEAAFGLSPLVLAPLLALLVFLCIRKGGGQIGRITALLVPVMSALYLGGALMLLWIFRGELLPVLGLIWKDAWNPRAIHVGVARGVFSNEAGLGTSVIAHAQSDVKEPVEQGMWGILEVFLDTILMCTVTGLALLVSGDYLGGNDGAVMTMDAFAMVYGRFGSWLITVCIFLFALSTMIGWSFFGGECVRYLWTDRFQGVYLAFYIGFIFIGCFGQLQEVWRLADICNSLLAVPNLLCLILLRKQVIRLTNVYLDSTLKEKN